MFFCIFVSLEGIFDALPQSLDFFESF